MPTTQQEAANIVGILNEYLSTEEAHELASRLDEKVGQETDNDSLKVTLKMLKSLYEPQNGVSKWKARTLWTILYSIITFHMSIILFNLLAMFVVIFLAPWYVSLPIASLIVNMTFSPLSCPLTRLEDSVRRKLGLPTIRHFMKYYFIDRIRKWRAKPESNS